MKNLFIVKLFVIFILAFTSFKCASFSSMSEVDLTVYPEIYLGWVDLNEEDWAIWGYGTQHDWINFIARYNSVFYSKCRNEWLSDKKIIRSNSKEDDNVPDSGLYIKLSDVRIDYDSSYLYVTVHFIDLIDNRELLVMPDVSLYGEGWGFEGFLMNTIEALAEFLYQGLYR